MWGQMGSALARLAQLSNKSVIQSSLLPNRHLSTSRKLHVALRSAVGCLTDPDDGNHVAKLGEVTGEYALTKMWNEMNRTEEGRSLLKEKPLLHDYDPSFVSSLPHGSLGSIHHKYMEANGFRMSERPPVSNVDDDDLAYVMTRYRQTHDLAHSAYGIDSSVEGELTLKLIEAITTGLPMPAIGSMFGILAAPSAADAAKRSACEILLSRKQLLTELYPWALRAARKVKIPIYAVRVEWWLDKPLLEFQSHCGIVDFPASFPQSFPKMKI